MNICVYGASSALLEDIYYKKTEELGREIGRRGHGLVFGWEQLPGAQMQRMGISWGLRRVFLKNQVSFMKIARNLFLRRL